MSTRELLTMALAAILGAVCAFQGYALHQVSEARKQASTVFVCYDQHGQQTASEDWKECRAEKVYTAWRY